MPKDINILIVEDDLYARDLMTLLLTRDWRTRVIGEVSTEDDLRSILETTQYKIDAILIDTEVPGDPEFSFRLAQLSHHLPHRPKIITTATKPDPAILRRMLNGSFHGHLIKREVRYCLATAIALVVKKNQWVITPSVHSAALQERVPLPANTVILDGTQQTAQLTQREEEVARLAILFNLAHRDLADELLIRADQVSKYVSNTYTKLGLDEILGGEIEPEVFFKDLVVLRHFKDILGRVEAGARRKTSDMATLAFHLLTKPDIADPSE